MLSTRIPVLWKDYLRGRIRASPAPVIGGVPEWLKGTGCKPVGYAYVGSNPTPSTIFAYRLPPANPTGRFQFQDSPLASTIFCLRAAA